MSFAQAVCLAYEQEELRQCFLSINLVDQKLDVIINRTVLDQYHKGLYENKTASFIASTQWSQQKKRGLPQVKNPAIFPTKKLLVHVWWSLVRIAGESQTQMSAMVQPSFPDISWRSVSTLSGFSQTDHSMDKFVTSA